MVSARNAVPLTIDDLAREAAEVMPHEVWDFVSGGAGEELTLKANRGRLDVLTLIPRVLRGISAADPRTLLAGTPCRTPIGVAPMAYQRLVHPAGEPAAAAAARDQGVPFIASMLSSSTIEQICAVGGSTWLQLYWLRDHRQTLSLVTRAEDAGASAIVVTVDAPWMGRRNRDERNAFQLPPSVIAENLSPALARNPSQPGSRVTQLSGIATHTRAVFDPTFSWRDLDELRRRTSLPLVVKGVLHPDDATRAVESGADAVVVSNHGGRQLDGVIASIDALPAVRAAVGGRTQVLLDGGIRRGIDVLKALAAGADGVLIGRPVLWALATGGQEGVGALLRLVADELVDALGLAGCADLAAARELRTVSRP